MMKRLRYALIGILALSVSIALWLRSKNAPITASASSQAVTINSPVPVSSERTSKTNNDTLASVSSSNVDANPAAHPLDEVLELAKKSLEHMRKSVDDYSGTMLKRERINGKLGSEVVLEFKIRSRKTTHGSERPISVYLNFLEPSSARGREVIWVEGARDNKLVAHEGGFKNLLRLELDPTGTLAMIDNKYPITEIGLERMVEKLIEKGQRDRAFSPCDVQVLDDQKVGDQLCKMIQVTHANPDPKYDFHIAQVFIDTERLVPLRYAAFGFPKQPGQEPLLEEEYTYLKLNLNIGLSDVDFDPDNPKYNFP